jgi:betaine-aldehyde dehydrogenase
MNPTGPALNLIAGTWRDSQDRRPSYDPASGETIGEYACATTEDTVHAIAAAKSAFDTTQWASDRRLRARVLNSMADLVEAHQDELIDLLSLDNGKIKKEAAFEISLVAPKLRWWAAMALADQGGRAADLGGGKTSMVLREPVGVAGIIVPFNSPVILAVRSLGPALAAGTTTVVKFPEEAAQICYLFTRIVSQAEGLPDGVLNTVVTDVTGGNALITSPDVPVISFTGSTATGRAIAAQGAARLKRFSLELGGKSPMIVCPTADLDAAIPVLTRAVTVFAGQFCMAGSRLLVHDSLADEVRDRLKKSFESLRPGPATDPDSDLGPLIDQHNVARVDAAVQEAIAMGASVIVRGGPSAEPHLQGGAFYHPSLLEVDDNTLPIIQQETFGPVLTMQTFRTEDEAVSLANSTEYGLAASIWTRDVDQPLRMARRVAAGTIWVNDWALVHDEFEEGGYKQSGIGRLNGLAALEDFVEYKHIAFSAAATH